MARISGTITATILALLLLGCDAAVLVGGRTIGISSGQFVNKDGAVEKLYALPFEEVWPACEKALMDMKASDVEMTRKIAAGSMRAIVRGDKVIVNISYVSEQRTTVAVLVGTAGNNTASELIHEKILEILRRPPSRPLD